MSKKHCINSLFYDLDQASRICRLFGEKNFKMNCDCDLVFDEFIILDTIACNPNICQADLANLLLKGVSHTSKLLAQLCEKGYIERPLDTKGNRVIKRIIFTEKGKEIYKKTESQMLKFIAKIEETIDRKEVEECRKFLQKIKATIKATGYVQPE